MKVSTQAFNAFFQHVLEGNMWITITATNSSLSQPSYTENKDFCQEKSTARYGDKSKPSEKGFCHRALNCVQLAGTEPQWVEILL
jgi:hypothetical protein